MPDMLPTFKSGDPRTKALNAGFLNNVTDRLRNIPQQSLPSSRSGGGQHVLSVYAINNSGGDIDERSVMAIDTVGLNIATDQEMINFQERPLASIDIPTASTNFPVVALESIRDGEIGKVAISGAVVCMVNVTDAGHAYANPTAGDETKMTSGATGQVRILYKPGGTGNKRCWVYLVEQSGAASPASSGASIKEILLNSYEASEDSYVLSVPTGQTLIGNVSISGVIKGIGGTFTEAYRTIPGLALSTTIRGLSNLIYVTNSLEYEAYNLIYKGPEIEVLPFTYHFAIYAYNNSSPFVTRYLRLVTWSKYGDDGSYFAANGTMTGTNRVQAFITYTLT